MSDPGSTPLTVLMAGLGGQGVVTAGDLLIAAALYDGYEVKKSEIHGLSRRFGSVSCQVRLGSPLHSPLRGHGGIDILLALEGYEALKQLPYLKPEGVGLVNEFWLRPAAVQTGTDSPPSREDPRLQWFPGTAQAQDLEAPRSLNYYMLGVVAEWLPLSQPSWDQALAEGQRAKPVPTNRHLFDLGRAAAQALRRRGPRGVPR
jgi:indolepyruvate ferredoxin oxidoreductase beta subunit